MRRRHISLRAHSAYVIFIVPMCASYGSILAPFPGEGRIHACLRKNRAKLSGPCKQEELILEQQEADHIELRPGLLQVRREVEVLFRGPTHTMWSLYTSLNVQDPAIGWGGGGRRCINGDCACAIWGSGLGD